MWTTPPVNSQFGQALAFAERTMTATLREHLAQRDTTPETWYALQLLATRGPGLTRQALSRDLEGSQNLNGGTVRELLARLEAGGLIHGGARVGLTARGHALHRSLREYIAAPTARLLGQFDSHDIETTIHTLQAIGERAADEAAAAQ